MSNSKPNVIVAGHICLDIIPSFEIKGVSLASLLVPGKLSKVGPATVATGGAVSNTGLALHRLGVATRLMGKVGDDAFGRAILDVVRRFDPALASGMIVAAGEHSSYTVVISPPGVDRMFLHCHGANDTFRAADVTDEALADADYFHFGYPPLMRGMYRDNGVELLELFQRVRGRGLTTSLDMAMPDPASEAGQLNWPALLQPLLPSVNIFLPSFDEMLQMLGRPVVPPDGKLLAEIAGQLLEWGAETVGLKLGDQGLYLRTATEEMLSPCFTVDVVGTTGSGDSTIAGFLAGLVKGLPLTEALTGAVAVGACCCEKPDATGGIPHWDFIQQRLANGWPRRPVRLKLDGWQFDDQTGLWFGPHNQ